MRHHRHVYDANYVEDDEPRQPKSGYNSDNLVVFPFALMGLMGIIFFVAWVAGC